MHFFTVLHVVFNIGTLVYRSLSSNALSPGYLADSCLLVADTHVRRQTTAFCRHSNTRSQSGVQQQFWRQDLSATGPQVWNILPPNPISDYIGYNMANSCGY